MASPPSTLADYPWVIVNFSCKLCSRRGCYRLARLAARYGPDQTLDGLQADLAHTCPYWRSKSRQYEVRCGARFEDLDRPRPQDLPGTPREREPSRESLPQRRLSSSAPPSQTPTISLWRSDTIELVCDKCAWRCCTDAAVALREMGDIRLTDLRTRLIANCPRVKSHNFTDGCGARFVLIDGE